MALVFPSNPNVNDTYTVNGRTYVWNGTTWRTIKAPVPDVLPTLSVDNNFSAGGVLHVDSENNEIGIGTAAPSHQLHLTQDLGVDGNLIVGGTITVPTPTAGTNDTTAATTAFVQNAISSKQDSSTALTTSTSFGGDVSGTYDAIVIADDSHNHIISNVDGLQTALDAKQNSSTALTTSTAFSGDVSGTYNAMVVADDSHNHIIGNVDGLQTALDAKLPSSSYTAADVLTKIKTVDGAGSGLDADTLDGVQGDNYATKTYVDTAVSNLVDAAPTTLDTLNELAAALGDDPNFATTVAASIGTKLDSSAYTASDVLTKIKTVDGTGSGLDADTLDGIQGANFLRSDTSDSMTGTLTATAFSGPLTGNVTGNADTATKLATARTISLTGDVTGSASFDGSANASITATVADDSHNHIISNVDGLQTALDGKLSSSSYTAADVLTKISTVDGAGSGLDADLLDGNHASAFATSGHTHSYLPLSGGTLTGQLTMGTSASIRQSSTTWTGNPGSGVGKLEYHSNRWYVVAGSNSSEVARFRRDGSDVGHIANDGRLNFPFWSTTGRNYSSEWIQFDNHSGLYSPLNSAHFFPNSGSYGSWRIQGTRNSWQGLEFDTSNGQLSLMMTANANWYTGVHANGSGWRWYFINQDLYCNAYRGFNNVAGTGNASYHPNGIYSTGTNWLYGAIHMNGNTLNAGAINGSTITGGNYNASGYYYTSGGTQQTLIGGTNGQGAIYLGTGVGVNGTGGIEATWRNTTNPSISIGVVRDGDKTKMDFNYNGNSYWYVDNTIRLFCTTSGVQVQGTFTNYSSRALKENIEDANLLDGATPLDIGTTLSRWEALRPRVFDWKEKPMDKWWVGCDTHDNRFECEAEGCENDRVERIEHVCGKGWCYGTEEDPCPRYKAVRNNVHFIAEEVEEVLGSHVISYAEDRTISGINMQAFNTEHVHATQQLIKYTRELERRISELEAVL